MSDKPVVQTVPAARAYAGVFTLVALLGFAFTIGFATDRLAVIIPSALIAAFWAGGMILILPRVSERIVPPPQRIDADQLPLSVSIWKANLAGMVIMSVMGAAFVAWSLSMHEYFPIGILLGGPIVMWDGVRRAKRTEREQHGTLWNTTGFAWTSKCRARYLAAEV